MEEDIYNTPEKIVSPAEKLVNRRLESVIELAQERNNYEMAHNPELLRALAVVKKFISKRKRVLYGGTAMNAILPKSKQFYNPEVDLPDYDFFTPDLHGDVKDLVNELQSGGFRDVYHRIGIHEGTIKVLVSFTPIADITQMAKEVYETFLKRSIKKDGICYTDPDILRMMMYMEISRPKGQVNRWEKVYERLQLINKEFPPKARREMYSRKAEKASKKVQPEIWNGIYNYCIENQRIVITGDMDTYYRRVVTKSTPKFKLQDHSTVIGFLSPDVKQDGKKLQELLGGKTRCKLFIHRKRGEVAPEHIEVKYMDVPVALLVQEAACHSYLNFPLADGRSVAVASLDSLITIYYSLSIFTKRARQLIPGIDSKIVEFVKLVEQNRRYKDPNIPSFPISCRGYQKSFATLLREKTERTKKARDELDKLLE